MFRNLLIPTLMLGTAASPLLARDFGDGFFYVGEIELEYAGSDDNFETLGYASVDLGYQQSGGGFGGFIGLDSFAIDGRDATGFYGALSYSGDFGKVQIGAPRAALDDYIDTPILGGIRLFDLEIGSLTRSIVTTANLLYGTDTPTGIRYDGTFGAAAFGASYHEIESAKVYTLGGTYTLGTVVLRAGMETVEGTETDASSYFLGAESTFGPVKAGVMFSDTEVSGSATATQLYAVYSPMEKLDVTATVFLFETVSTDQTLYGLSADYRFYQDVYVQAGLVTNDGNTAYDISLGVDF